MNDEYINRLDAINDKVDAAIVASGENNKEEFIKRLTRGVAKLVIYSAYEVVDDMPINNLDDVAFKGTFVVTGFYDRYWDGMGGWYKFATGYKNESKSGGAYKSDPITDPTWLQLAVLANECIIATNDLHHVFFEGIDANGDGTLRLLFGS